MFFEIEHRTHYHYAGPALESFMESRLTPMDNFSQRLLQRELRTEPRCNVHHYVDYFGNEVETFSIIQRHTELVVTNHSVVETLPVTPPKAALELSISEARQIYRADKLGLFDYLMPSPAITLNAEVYRLANKLFRPGQELGESLLQLNHWVKTHFTYAPGSTRIDTPIKTVLHQRAGVCQDFAQVMIAILRSAELPARYVVGYIETETQKAASLAKRSQKLVGSAESHAWVEVQLPGGHWWPLDPTNDCVAGERHITVAVGRDYLDSTPTRGVFKGTYTRKLDVAVMMRRLDQAPVFAAPAVIAKA